MASGISINPLSEKAIFKYSMIFLLLFSTSMFRDVNGQGLESIIVEKYYIADSSDSRFGGKDYLPPGSVTYRVFVDLKPGYVLQSVYGDSEHQMVIGTSTNFYNHSAFGRNLANLIYDPYLPNSTMMIDSWLSVGSAGHINSGVLKTDDDTIGTVKNQFELYPVLQSENPAAGIPLKERDGLKTGGLPGKVTALNIDALLEMVDKMQAPPTGQEFKTSNGGWACLEGAKGFDKEKNRILIGQFTTSGNFYFELNLQIKKAGGAVEQYVARDAKGQNQFSHPTLIFSSVSASGN
jgi:hypothetical protein